MRASDLLIWGIVVHLVVDFLGQNEWMAVNKAKRRTRVAVEQLIEHKPRLDGSLEPLRVVDEKPPVEKLGPWWDRHPAAYIHAGMHGAAQLLVFPWWGALAIGVAHFFIDMRWPVVAWSKLIRQTQPSGDRYLSADAVDPNAPFEMNFDQTKVRTRVPIGDPHTPTVAAVGQLEKDQRALEARLARRARPVFDIGTEVRIWADQVWHIGVIAILALVTG